MLLMLGLGFASGLPLALTAGTLQAWMTTEGIDIKTIGLFSLVGLPYTFKFIWSPLMDRYTPKFLGRRRGWMVISQAALFVAIIALGSLQPRDHTLFVALLAVAIAFFSASQDIVIDAYRTEVLRQEEFGAGAGVAILGYRLGMLTSGALALILADHYSWQAVYAMMAGMLAVGFVCALVGPETQSVAAPKSLREAVIGPLRDYFQRPGAVEILLFIVLYRIDVVLANALTTPFMLQLGFSKTDIGALNKGLGLASSIAGSLLGGALIPRLGMKRALVIFGFLQCISTLCFSVLAYVGHHYPTLALSVSAENFCSGLGNAAFVAFLMSLCNKRYTATQYALLTSLGAVSRVFVGAPTGYLEATFGWFHYFNIATLSGIPGLLMIYRYERWTKNESLESSTP